MSRSARARQRGAPDGLVLALDIGATKTMVTTWSPGAPATEVAAWASGRSPTVRFPTDRDPGRLVTRIAAEARDIVQDRTIAAVGCAVPGPLDRASGSIVHSPNLGWHDVALGALLTDRLGAPVALDDDATAGALGEARFGAGRGADPFAYLTVSSGIGLGIVIAGRPLRGAHGLAGEIGHLVVDPGGPRCGCGRRGDVESLAGGASLARRARTAWPSGTLVAGRPAPRDADAIFRSARAGDPTARAMIDQAAEALGIALAAVGAVIDPAVIAVGGAIGVGRRAFVQRAAAIARRRCIAETGRSLIVVAAALGEQSVLAGAAALGADVSGIAIPEGP